MWDKFSERIEISIFFHSTKREDTETKNLDEYELRYEAAAREVQVVWKLHIFTFYSCFGLGARLYKYLRVFLII